MQNKLRADVGFRLVQAFVFPISWMKSLSDERSCKGIAMSTIQARGGAWAGETGEEGVTGTLYLFRTFF